jgi:predicted protein tyrosine phosphatase
MSSSAVVATSAAAPTEASIAAAAQAAKNQIQRSDDQTAAYKAALRTLPVDNDTNANTVAVEWIKVCMIPRRFRRHHRRRDSSCSSSTFFKQRHLCLDIIPF